MRKKKSDLKPCTKCGGPAGLLGGLCMLCAEDGKPTDRCIGCGGKCGSFDTRAAFGVVSPFCSRECRDRWVDMQGEMERKGSL